MKTTSEIIEEIERRMHDLQMEMENCELTHIERCNKASNQFTLHNLLDWIEEKDGE